jgi:6-phosphogluconolactonase (cycloisomerase 2 family)
VGGRRRKSVGYVSGPSHTWPKHAYVLAALSLAGLGGIAAIFLLRSQPRSTFDGFVYIESNTARPGANSVLAYRFRDNRLHLLGEFRTGGKGSVDQAVTGALDAEGQIAVDRSRKLLFAVNQGSDTIAAFHLSADGRLAAVAGSPFPAGGRAPASVAVAGPLLLVVDKAHDFGRELETFHPAYVTFRIGSDGRLTPTGKGFRAPPASSPTQVLALPESVVVGTEESGPFRAFTLGTDGSLRQGPNSPLAPESSIFLPRYEGSRWAIGLARHPTRRLLYANQAATEQLLVYSYDQAGRMTFVRAVENKGATLPCWTVVSPSGRFLYTANAGNGSVSAFDLRIPEEPRRLQVVHLRRGANPWGLALDPSGRTLFVVDPRAVGGTPDIVGNRLHVLAVGRDGRLEEIDDARVKLPVSANASPLGIAVVPRR